MQRELEQQRANTELLLYFSDLAGERRRRPGNDLVSAVAAMKVDNMRLPDEEVILNCVGLIAAGVDTTRLAAAGGLHALLQWPDQWRLLQADQALVELAVDEMVRWTSPVIHLYRTATEDVAVGNRQVRRNDRLIVWIPSLNRDERQFLNADHFVVSRTPNHHIGFGVGPHLCIGAALTRLELRVLFRELATTWKTVAVTGAARRFHSFLVHGIDYLPVSVVPH